MKQPWHKLSPAHQALFASHVQAYIAARKYMIVTLAALSRMFGGWATYEIEEIVDAARSEPIEKIYEALRRNAP